MYWPGKDRIDHVQIENLVQNAGILIRGLVGMGALFPSFGEIPQYHCKDCDQFHNSDDAAERLLISKIDRGVTRTEFNELPAGLTHLKAQTADAPTLNTYIPLAHRMTDEDRLGEFWTGWNKWYAKHPRLSNLISLGKDAAQHQSDQCLADR